MKVLVVLCGEALGAPRNLDDKWTCPYTATKYKVYLCLILRKGPCLKSPRSNFVYDSISRGVIARCIFIAFVQPRCKYYNSDSSNGDDNP